MQSAIMAAVLSFGLGFLSCGSSTRLPSLGSVEPEQLCGDVKRCDVRGDRAVSTLKTGPIHLADGQGPQSYLGKVAPKRVANSVLKTCGGDVAKDDWHESSPAPRTVELTDKGKLQLRGSLKSHLAEQLLAHPKALEGQAESVDSLVDAATQGLGLAKVGLLSQTYWLKDSAFERRVGQCGEEEYKDIIYSLTLLRLSDLTQQELESKLHRGLTQKLPVIVPSTPASVHPTPAREGDAAAASAQTAGGTDASVPPSASEQHAAPGAASSEQIAAHEALLQEIAYGAVQGLASELRTITALGFDEP